MDLYTSITEHPWFGKRTTEYYRWYPKTLNLMGNGMGNISKSTFNGIYIHVPFCDDICKFCPFNKRKRDDQLVATYVDSLCAEMNLYAAFTRGSKIDFIYFGGGTPSVLSTRQLDRILECARSLYPVAPDCEVSIEIHPSHITKSRLQDLTSVSINRFSSGVQTFSSKTLSKLGATHTIEDAIRAASLLSEFTERSAIDLLYRCEGQTLQDWENDIAFFLGNTDIGHLSCYTLYMPDETKQPSRYDDVKMAVFADEYLRSQGYNHYASCATGGFDYAKPGQECRYELQHWNAPQSSYIALGAGAIGYVSKTLTINVNNLSNYISLINAGHLPLLSASTVDPTEERHRFFSLGVKTITIDLQDYDSLFGSNAKNDFAEEIGVLKDLKLCEVNDNKFRLTDVGRFFVDQLSESFWSTTQRDVLHPETTRLVSLERKLFKGTATS